MTFLKRALKGFENEMAAAAVAQSGEIEMARQILKESVEQITKESAEKQDLMHLRVKPAEGK
ncbi:MAG: hypothetical protein GXO99_03115 [Nitrospirae bacterium]|nr:hypothetical protein [Nitrospirota bacterium]